jgi:endonuclease/exonuclease/phosphatase family metal-dependent hydrolase
VKFKERHSGDIFLFANTHFDHMGQVARTKSAELIKSKLSTLAGTLPVIVTGDFNCEPTEAPYAVMTDQGGLPLTDTRPSSETQGTFCTFSVDGPPCRTIDYIFHSATWKTKSYTVIQDHDGRYYPSDHLPVICTLSGL